MTTSATLLQDIMASIDKAGVSDQFGDKGQVMELKDGVAWVVGLTNASFSELVTFGSGATGVVMELLADMIGVLVLDGYETVSQGEFVQATGKQMSVGVGNDYCGRVLDGLGNPIDGKGDVSAAETYPVERMAPGVMVRKSVHQPLQTGIKAIDSMVPIGKGQRELIIGDRQTGKTAVAIDTIINQKGKDVKCIYVAIGQKDTKIRRIVQTLQDAGALEYTVVVNASSANPAVVQYFAPYVGCAIGEYFMDTGQDALIIYDDLSKHAIAYREMSLLLRRPPGREAYPGDIFYQHSKLLERAAKLNDENGGGSLTALPIIQTLAGDISAYVPTNVISITDGQIFLESNLFNAGVRPAINVGQSVSRVGGSAQTKLMKKVAGKLRLDLATYRSLAAFAQFSADLDPATQKKLARGERMVEVLKQSQNKPLSFAKQAATIYAGTNGFVDDLPVEQVRLYEQRLHEKLDGSAKKLLDQMLTDKKLTDAIQEGLDAVCAEVREEMHA